MANREQICDKDLSANEYEHEGKRIFQIFEAMQERSVTVGGVTSGDVDVA